MAIHNSPYNSAFFSTTPPTNLAYLVVLVKRQEVCFGASTDGLG